MQPAHAINKDCSRRQSKSSTGSIFRPQARVGFSENADDNNQLSHLFGPCTTPSKGWAVSTLKAKMVICWLMIQRKHLMVMVPPTQEAFTDGWKSSPSPFSATALKRLLVLLLISLILRDIRIRLIFQSRRVRILRKRRVVSSSR